MSKSARNSKLHCDPYKARKRCASIAALAGIVGIAAVFAAAASALAQAPAQEQGLAKGKIPELASAQFAWLALGVTWFDPPPGLGRGPIRSDPAHPLTDPYGGYSGAHDYRAFVGKPGLLTFDTAPLERDVTVVGAIRATIMLSTDARDTDLWVRVLDVAPDGTAWNLMNPGLDLLRASYRHESLAPELLKPGRVYPIELDELLTGNVFRQGHRIRVQLSTAFFPWFSRNLNTGLSEVTSDSMQTAHVVVHHDRKWMSSIVLPVVKQP